MDRGVIAIEDWAGTVSPNIIRANAAVKLTAKGGVWGRMKIGGDMTDLRFAA